MKKEFSFYEFVGLIVPSVILLYSVQLLIFNGKGDHFFDSAKLGDSAIFIVISYGIGHILQFLGEKYARFIWKKYFGSEPTQWLTTPNHQGKLLFYDDAFNTEVATRIKVKFPHTVGDYGPLTYNYLFQNNKTARIDIFNGNYSLFRGLSISFLTVALVSIFTLNWFFAVIAIVLFVISGFGMVAFGRYYATEVFRTFYNAQDAPPVKDIKH